MKNKSNKTIAPYRGKITCGITLFTKGVIAFMMFLVLTPIYAGQGTGGIPEVLRQLEAIQARLDTIESNQQMTDAELAEVKSVTQATSLDVSEHRLGSADKTLDATISWCFKGGGLLKVEPKTLLRGTFEGRGRGGVNAYGNGVVGLMHLGTQGKVETGWEASGGTEVSICVNGSVLKEFTADDDTATTTAQRATQRTTFRTSAQEELLARALIAQAQIRDELVDNLNQYGMDGTKLPDMISRSQAMNMDLKNPLKLLTGLKDNVRERVDGLPMPQAIRDKLDGREDLGIIDGLSEQLSDPKSIFCDLAANNELNMKLRSRMAKVCEANGEKIKASIDKVENVVGLIRDKLPKGKDRVINVLGANDWKKGADD